MQQFVNVDQILNNSLQVSKIPLQTIVEHSWDYDKDESCEAIAHAAKKTGLRRSILARNVMPPKKSSLGWIVQYPFQPKIRSTNNLFPDKGFSLYRGAKRGVSYLVEHDVSLEAFDRHTITDSWSLSIIKLQSPVSRIMPATPIFRYEMNVLTMPESHIEGAFMLYRHAEVHSDEPPMLRIMSRKPEMQDTFFDSMRDRQY